MMSDCSRQLRPGRRTSVLARMALRLHDAIGASGRRIAVAALAANQLLALRVPAQGAQPIVVRDAASCAACTVVVRRVARLGTDDGPGLISSNVLGITVDSQGRYWVLSGNEPPLVFDSTGKFRAIVGRRGQGPGEFMRPIDALAIAGDSVLIVDGALARATVVGPDLVPSRTLRLVEPLRPLMLLHWPNDIIANGTVGLPNVIGWPLHRVSFATNEAALRASFGPDSGEVRPQDGPQLQQVLAPSPNGGFWSADVLRYRATLWSEAGDKLLTLERRPAWFSGMSRFWIGNPSTPPPPAISAIAEDESGALWVFVRLAAPTWREGWPKGVGRDVAVSSLSFERMFQTTIEVIDRRAQRVVTRTTVPYWVIATLPSMRAAVYSVDRAGVPHIDIFALEIRQSNSR